ncbi:MAG: hypothetical protein ABFR33_06230 [Verrucomicrobiota bacterium]
MNEATESKQKGYGLFALAAAIYTAGVIAFSVWSYFQQRANLLAQVDRSLVNATHATEQILGNVFIACAVETETTYELGYAANQENLNRFANDCHFDLLGAVGRKGAKTWGLIAGGEENGNCPVGPSCLHDPLCPELSSLVRTVTSSQSESIQMQTVGLGEHGEIRVAIRYHPMSDDAGYAILVARSTRNVNHLIRTLGIRTVAIGVLLYAMAFPLILLYNRIQAKSARETDKLNARLRQDVNQRKEREAELEDAIHDLERFNNVAVGRETRIIELKAEVNTLLEQMGRQKRYNIDHVDKPFPKPNDG